jgi:hypothetical protein
VSSYFSKTDEIVVLKLSPKIAKLLITLRNYRKQTSNFVSHQEELQQGSYTLGYNFFRAF